jgi:hypothetical protein
MEVRTKKSSFGRKLITALLTLGLATFAFGCPDDNGGNGENGGEEDTGMMDDTEDDDMMDTSEDPDTDEEPDTTEDIIEDSGDDGDAGEPSTARVQIIHVAPGSDVDTVDIWELKSEERLVDDLDYEAATGFRDLPAGETLTLGVAPGDSSSVDDVISASEQDVNFTEDSTRALVASGIASNSENFEKGSERSFGFEQGDAKESGGIEGSVEANVFHGTTDAPTPVDVRDSATGQTTFVNDLGFQKFSEIKELPGNPSEVDVDVTNDDGSETAGTFTLPIGQYSGDYITIVASGFVTPEDEPVDEDFKLLVVKPNGDINKVSAQ